MFDKLHPSQYPDEQKVHWLSECDAKLYKDWRFFLKDTEAPETPYDPAEAEETELMLGEPWIDLYLLYLLMQVDFWNREITAYNNDLMLWLQRLSEWGDWASRGGDETAPDGDREARYIKV